MWVVEFLYRGGATQIKGPFETKELAEAFAKENRSCPGDEPVVYAKEVDNMSGWENDPWELTWPEPKK